MIIAIWCVIIVVAVVSPYVWGGMLKAARKWNNLYLKVNKDFLDEIVYAANSDEQVVTAERLLESGCWKVKIEKKGDSENEQKRIN